MIPIDLDTLVAQPGVAPKDWQSKAPTHLYTGRKLPIQKSPDLSRILALPRRPVLDLSSDRAKALIELMTNRFKRNRTTPCSCSVIAPERFLGGNNGCIKVLNAAQAWALFELGIVQGLEGAIGVGFGKCLSDAEYLDYSTGNRRHVSEVVGTVGVASLDKKLIIRPASVFASGYKQCVRVTLRDGSSIDASSDHPILTHRGWVHAAELQPGRDFVSVAAELPDCNITQARDTEVSLVAYFLSDGGCSTSTLHFTNRTSAVIQDWQYCTVLECGGWSERPSRSKAREFSALETNELRKKWGLYGLAKNKRCHPSLWGLPKRQVALFLNRFWACDGHVNKHGIECTLASEKLIDDLRFLGSRLGVHFTKKYKKASYVKDGIRHIFDSWRIYAYGGDALRFLESVGEVLGKEDACQKLRLKLTCKKRNTNHDIVPIGRREIREICDELGYKARASKRIRTDIVSGYFKSTQGQYISRQKFLDFCESYDYQGKYAHLASIDRVWERVTLVTDIGVQPVYDLSVPGTHNFVANSMVVHNTVLGLLSPLALADAWQDEHKRKGQDVDRVAFTVLLLVPPGLQKQLALEYKLLAQHFRVPSIVFHALPITEVVEAEPTLHVYPYSKLSNAKATTFFRQLKPHAILADEAHLLRDPDSVRTSRFLGYMDENPQVRFANWTGSLTDSSIEDYGHLIAHALKHRSPLPLDPQVLREWAGAIDPVASKEGKDGWQADPAALLEGLIKTGCQKPGEHVYAGFHRRLTETQGFISVSVPAITCAIEIFERKPDQPNVMGDLVPNTPKEDERAPEGYWPGIADALQQVRALNLRPDGEELLEAFAIARCARELSSGFFYRWIFPRGESESLIAEWRAARKNYRCEVREKLKRREEHLDSPYLCQLAAQRFYGEIPKGEYVESWDEETGQMHSVNLNDLPEWDSECWPRWRDVKEEVKPDQEPVWIDDYLVLDAAEWATEHTGIVWYDMHAFGARVAKLSRKPMFGGGAKALDRLVGNKEKGIKGEDGSRSIILSIDAHGTGRDGLQRLFNEQLVANPLSTGSGWEQLLGRLHRIGQLKGVTRTWFYRHTIELRKHVDQALKRAFYADSTIGGSNKLRVGFRMVESDT